MNGALQAVLLIAQSRDWDDHHMDWDGGWWILMMLGMVLIVALVVVGIVWLVQTMQHGGRGTHRPHEPTPLELLDRRLAEGAITVEEYEQRRRVLRESAGGG
jgi:putative membrane protein